MNTEILLVETNKALRNQISSYLKTYFKVVVFEFEDIGEIVSKIHTISPSLMILNIEKSNEIEFIKTLKSINSNIFIKDIAIVVTSSNNNILRKYNWLDYNVKDKLRKPFSIEDLSYWIRKSKIAKKDFIPEKPDLFKNLDIVGQEIVKIFDKKNVQVHQEKVTLNDVKEELDEGYDELLETHFSQIHFTQKDTKITETNKIADDNAVSVDPIDNKDTTAKLDITDTQYLKAPETKKTLFFEELPTKKRLEANNCNSEICIIRKTKNNEEILVEKNLNIVQEYIEDIDKARVYNTNVVDSEKYDQYIGKIKLKKLLADNKPKINKQNPKTNTIKAEPLPEYSNEHKKRTDNSINIANQSHSNIMNIGDLDPADLGLTD